MWTASSVALAKLVDRGLTIDRRCAPDLWSLRPAIRAEKSPMYVHSGTRQAMDG